jgi:hypothetical protein
LKTKGPDGAEQGTRDSEGPAEEAGPTPPAETSAPEAEGGEELTESKILESILRNEATRPTTKTNKEVVDKLVKLYPDKFEAQKDVNRIANKTKMTAKEFEKILKQDIKAKNIKIIPKKTDPNPSSKFDLFQFDTISGPGALLLSAGASANAGTKFEKDLVDRIKAAAGTNNKDIQDPVVAKIFKQLGIDGSKLSSKDVIPAGETDTKRPLNFDGPQNRGKQISDIIINYKGNPYYLSIKNVSGSGIYNGGVVPGIVFNKNKSKIVFDEEAYNSNKNVKNILDALGVDPKKIVSGLNNNIFKKGKQTEFQQVDADLELITKLLGSAIDYGYYYIREIPGGDVKIYNINSPEEAAKLLGTPSGVFIKYAGPSTKITTIRVPLEDSALGLKRADVNIRNATGGVDKPVIKINLF